MAIVHTRGRFFRTVLDELGVTVRRVGRAHRRECVTALLGQSRGESGTEVCGPPGAKANPLNTTYNLAPCTNFNSVGVKNYLNGYNQGITATVDTFKLSYYDGVRRAFLDPKADAVKIAEAIAASPWGTGQLAVTATKSLVANPALRRQTWFLKVG